jgi:hypothetical protein
MQTAAFIAASLYFIGAAWAVTHLLLWHDRRPELLLAEVVTILGAGFLLGRSMESLRDFLTTVKIENPAEYKAKREYHDDDLNRLAGEISQVMKAYREPPQPQPPAILEPSADRLRAAGSTSAAGGTPPAGSTFPSAATPETAETGGSNIPPNPFA